MFAGWYGSLVGHNNLLSILSLNHKSQNPIPKHLKDCLRTSYMTSVMVHNMREYIATNHYLKHEDELVLHRGFT